jgi:predicted transcriptional regulator
VGRQKQLAGGQLEAVVMGILWDRGGWSTPGDVHVVVSGERPLAYNTVLTIMMRLFDKGRLERQRDGRAYAYRPLVSREEYAAARMEQLLDDAKDRPAALARFLEHLGDADRAELRRLLTSAARKAR